MHIYLYLSTRNLAENVDAVQAPDEYFLRLAESSRARTT